MKIADIHSSTLSDLVVC